MSNSPYRDEFTVAREEAHWVATHVETGIASHGDDPNQAIEMATEAVELAGDQSDPAPDAEHDESRREYGIDVPEEERGIESPDGLS